MIYAISSIAKWRLGTPFGKCRELDWVNLLGMERYLIVRSLIVFWDKML